MINGITKFKIIEVYKFKLEILANIAITISIQDICIYVLILFNSFTFNIQIKIRIIPITLLFVPKYFSINTIIINGTTTFGNILKKSFGYFFMVLKIFLKSNFFVTKTTPF